MFALISFIVYLAPGVVATFGDQNAVEYHAAPLTTLLSDAQILAAEHLKSHSLGEEAYYTFYQKVPAAFQVVELGCSSILTADVGTNLSAKLLLKMCLGRTSLRNDHSFLTFPRGFWNIWPGHNLHEEYWKCNKCWEVRLMSCKFSV